MTLFRENNLMAEIELVKIIRMNNRTWYNIIEILHKVED